MLELMLAEPPRDQTPNKYRIAIANRPDREFGSDS
jgi:hypothetical protein